jgi:hypothetical protein
VSAELAGVPLAGGRAGTAWVSAWSDALTELEMDLHAAEVMLHHLPEIGEVSARRWTPPIGLGPLPASLQTRAQSLLDRHVEVTRQTAEAIVQTRAHLRAVTSMRALSPTVPVYVDTCV